MKTATRLAGLMVLAGALVFSGCARKQASLWQSLSNPANVQQLKSFVAEKEAQANGATNEAPPEFAAFFAAAKEGNWATANGIFKNFQKHAGQYAHTSATDERLRGTKWQDVIEVWGGLDAFADGDEKYSSLFGNEIVNSIPPGSIYFGGTDPGRFLVTAMEKSQVDADPFFLLTQNALADSTYLNYIRTMYVDKIYIPTAEDSQQCFDDYYKDVKERMAKGQLLPGESVTTGPDGKMQANSHMSVVQINGLLAKLIFEKNTNRDFYVEESFPQEWMYPYLEPHGLIFKLNREPLASLPEDVVQQDHDYWTKMVSPMIGNWLTDDTSVQDIGVFAEKVYLKHDFSGFTGDPAFVKNEYAHKTFSKERSSIAGLYAWRAQHTHDIAEEARMKREADYAFRQTVALCPYSPEAVFRYVGFLMEENRVADALAVAQTAAKFRSEQGVAQVDSLVSALRQQMRMQ